MDHLVYDGLYSLNDVSRIDGRDHSDAFGLIIILSRRPYNSCAPQLGSDNLLNLK
jgi:hypothetical protein